ncbi:MAG: hypothetical protein EP332_09425 [Bacteroidetes bacterium]|nr:MAG: hypothetical protein EP332_09425 [Bacteroidota bacterium]
MFSKTKSLLLSAALGLLTFSSCQQLVDNNPFIDKEPTTTDSTLRARELNDSAITVAAKDMTRYGRNALEVLDASIALDPSYDKPQVNKLGILLQMKKYKDALAASDGLVKLKSNEPAVYLIRGMLYHMIGEAANASAEIEYCERLSSQADSSKAQLYQGIFQDSTLSLYKEVEFDSTRIARFESLLFDSWTTLKNN